MYKFLIGIILIGSQFAFANGIESVVLAKKLNPARNFYGMDDFAKKHPIDFEKPFRHIVGNVKKIQIDVNSSRDLVAMNVYGDRHLDYSYFIVYSKSKDSIIFQNAIMEVPYACRGALKNATYGNSPIFMLFENDMLLVWNPFFENASVVRLTSAEDASFMSFRDITSKYSIKKLSSPFSVLLGPAGTTEMTLLKGNKMLLPMGGGFYNFVKINKKRIWKR